MFKFVRRRKGKGNGWTKPIKRSVLWRGDNHRYSANIKKNWKW